MGKVIRHMEFDSRSQMEEFLKGEFNFSEILEEGQHKNQELKDILVNLDLEYEKEKVKLTISKLVTLKAFLLSKEQGMNITELLFKIDNIMKMSGDRLNKSSVGILDDNNLAVFFKKANIDVVEKRDDIIVLSDTKRSASVNYKDGYYCLNTIELIEEF